MKARRRLASWYFAYFAFIGAYLPYFGLYLQSLALSPSEIGILMSLGQVMRMVVPALWGWLSDRSGLRTPIIRFSASLSLLCFGAYFFTDAFIGLMAATLLLHLFWTGALPLVEALTFAHLNDDPDGYGRIRMWGSIGFICAVLWVGFILDHQPIRSVLWSGWGLLAAIVLFAWGLDEAPAARSGAGPRAHGRLAEPRVLVLMVGGFFMAAAHGPLYVFYSIHLVDFGYGKALAGALWSLGVIAEILVFLAMPRLARVFSLKLILTVSFALAVLRFAMIGWWVGSLPLLLCAQVMHGATFGAHHAATLAALNQWFAAEQQGRVQALYGSLSFGAGGVVGAMLAGHAWERWGGGVTYTFASLFALVGLLVVVLGMPAGAAGQSGRASAVR